MHLSGCWPYLVFKRFQFGNLKGEESEEENREFNTCVNIIIRFLSIRCYNNNIFLCLIFVVSPFKTVRWGRAVQKTKNLLCIFFLPF